MSQKYHELNNLSTAEKEKRQIVGGTIALEHGIHELTMWLPFTPKQVHTHFDWSQANWGCGQNPVDTVTWFSQPNGVLFRFNIESETAQVDWIASPEYENKK